MHDLSNSNRPAGAGNCGDLTRGPNLVAVASRGLGSGRNSALIAASGLACGAFLWSFLTAVGLGSHFGTYPQLLKILVHFGGAYLLWLGIKGWRAALTGPTGHAGPTTVDMHLDTKANIATVGLAYQF